MMIVTTPTELRLEPNYQAAKAGIINTPQKHRLVDRVEDALFAIYSNTLEATEFNQALGICRQIWPGRAEWDNPLVQQICLNFWKTGRKLEQEAEAA